MKEWNKPTLSELEIKVTECTVNVPDMTSSVLDQFDLGTCHNPYWEGNGLSKKEAIKENPFWGGNWGDDKKEDHGGNHGGHGGHGGQPGHANNYWGGGWGCN